MDDIFIGEWWVAEVEPTTRCKHGKDDCATCGTSDRRDVVHTARTPSKRTARRLRRRASK